MYIPTALYIINYDYVIGAIQILRNTFFMIFPCDTFLALKLHNCYKFYTPPPTRHYLIFK